MLGKVLLVIVVIVVRCIRYKEQGVTIGKCLHSLHCLHWDRNNRAKESGRHTSKIHNNNTVLLGASTTTMYMVNSMNSNQKGEVPTLLKYGKYPGKDIRDIHSEYLEFLVKEAKRIIPAIKAELKKRKAQAPLPAQPSGQFSPHAE